MNKKVVNATPTAFDGVKFKSQLEKRCYKELVDSGLDFHYELDKIILWEGVKLDTAESWNSIGRLIVKDNKKLRDITYTPDFKILHKNYIIYVDVKGHPNDIYPIKKKMFLKVLEEYPKDRKYIFMEIHTVGNMIEAIAYIKNL